MTRLLAAGALALTFAAGVAASPSFAADWRHPYSNIDHRVDNGNNTGDSQVDRLNQAELSQNGHGNDPGAWQSATPNVGSQSANATGQTL